LCTAAIKCHPPTSLSKPRNWKRRRSTLLDLPVHRLFDKFPVGVNPRSLLAFFNFANNADLSIQLILMATLNPVLFIGPFPPPVTGHSSINKYVRTAMLSNDLNVYSLCTSSPSLLQTNYLQRMLVLARTSLNILIVGRRCPVAYFSFSGGLGIIFELIYASICVCVGKKLVCHHHSFSYVIKPSLLMLLYCKLFGRLTTHVFLGQGMAEKYFDIYSKGDYILLSNSTFVYPCSELSVKRSQDRVHSLNGKIIFSHMSNLSVEKGLLEYLAMARSCLNAYPQFEFRLAGPFTDPFGKRYYDRIKNILTNLAYGGPLYSHSKSTFFESCDFFVFPTHYPNEAEPLVILEAMSYGCIPLSTNRGLIADILPDFIPTFARDTFEIDSLNYALSVCSKIVSIKRSIRMYYANFHAQSRSQLARFIDLLGAF